MSDSSRRERQLQLQLHRDRFPGRAVFDTAISHAMLRGVSAGIRQESLRLYRPDNALLFSSLDARRPGYARAVEIAREAGFEPVIRLAGGHAAVFLEESVAFAWASPDPNAQQHIRTRFTTLTDWIVGALSSLGLDARVGEVEGEYCPGEYSVNLEGRVKVMGVGQRVVRGAAHVGGVLTVGSTMWLREILIPIYDALDLEFDPETAGGVADFDAALTPERVIEVLIETVEAEGYAISSGRFGDPEMEAAEQLTALHDPERKPGAGAALRPSLQQVGGKALVHDRNEDDPA